MELNYNLNVPITPNVSLNSTFVPNGKRPTTPEEWDELNTSAGEGFNYDTWYKPNQGVGRGSNNKVFYNSSTKNYGVMDLRGNVLTDEQIKQTNQPWLLKLINSQNGLLNLQFATAPQVQRYGGIMSYSAYINS